MSGEFNALSITGQSLRRRRSRSRRGAIYLEFALVVPLYVLAIMSTVVGGVRIYQTQQYAAMAKFLGRKAIVHGDAADKLGPWGPTTIYGSFGDGSEVGDMLSVKYNKGQPTNIYYRLTWPDGGNNGLRGDRVEVTIASSSLSGGMNTSTNGPEQGLGMFSISSTVVMTIAH